MSIYNKYQINVNLIPGLPQELFRNGKPEGVVQHATAVYNDDDNGERSYETNHWNDAYVHTFSDNNQILQVADFKYLAYHCCHSGNIRYLGNEVCQTHDHDLFLQSYDRWVWLAARQLFDLRLPVIDGETLLSHAQVSQKFRESTHDDPCGMDGKSGYLAEHGKTWQDVVNDVTNYYKQMETEYMLDKDAVESTKKLISDVWNLVDDQKKKDVLHFLNNCLREAMGEPKQD